MKTVITFDFDGTIGHLPYLQKLAKCLVIDKANEVHIVTRRYNYIHPLHGDEMTQVHQVAKAVGIKTENVHFTNREYKVLKLQELNADIHYDDDQMEIALIRQHFPKCKGFVVFL